MRVALAGVLFAQPDLLLLDEPTNYLDLEGALWLESYLAQLSRTPCIIISHDREPAEPLGRRASCTSNDTKLTLYQGPYDTFARTRARAAASS